MSRLVIAILITVFSVLCTAQAASTRSVTDDLGRLVTVPLEPQRIAVLHDKNLGTPLIELGVLPVGSHGRTTADGKPFIRGSITVTGLDFDNSTIEYLGGNPADIEAISAVQPDLILTSTWQKADVDQLSKIAPTVVVDTTARETIGVFPLLAETTGKTAELEQLEQRYQAQINQIKRIIDTNNIRVSVLQGANGSFFVQHTYSTLGKVLRDAGFQFPEAVNAIDQGAFESWSAERLQDLDADIIFMTYRTDKEQVPQDARDAITEVFPGWCRRLHACRESQVVILPRAEATSASYDALMALSFSVLTAVSSQDIVRMAR